MLNIPIRQVPPLDESSEKITRQVKQRQTLDESISNITKKKY